MGCVERGDLRAFLDGELVGSERVRVEDHLASCLSCGRDLEALRVNASLAQSALDRVAPKATEVPQPAWSQIRDRAEGRVRRPVTLGWRLSQMLGDLFRFVGGGRVRMAVSTAAALAIVALLFTLSPVQTVASSFLSIFRVQKFVAVQVDPTAMPKIASPGELGSFKTTGDRTMKVVTPQDAERAVGFKMPVPSTLPSVLQASPTATMVTGSYSVTFTPDLKKVRAYLAAIGAANVQLPDNLDGAPITLQMPPTASTLYLEKGASVRNAEGVPMPAVGQKFLYLGAGSSPTMNVPDGLNVDQIRTEVLKMPGLPADLVNQLKSIDDWRSTVVVPVVKGTSHEVSIQGQTGLAIVQPDGQGASLIWPRDGKVYVISGSFSESELLAVANSLK